MSDDEGCPHGHLRYTCTACGDIAYLRGIEAERDAALASLAVMEGERDRLRDELGRRREHDHEDLLSKRRGGW